MHRRGDGDGARSLLHESLTLADRLGLQEATAWAKEQLGLIAAAGGEPAAAATLLCESLAVHHDLGDRWRTAAVLDALAGLGADARHRARLLAAAGRLREEVGTPLPPSDRAEHDQRVRAVRDALGPGELAGVTAQGRALSVEQAVTEALGAPVPATDAPASRPGPAVPAPAAVSPSRPGTRSHTPPAEVTVRALGRSGVAVAGRTLGPEDWTYAKPRELLYHLLTRPGATKAEIGLALWPEASRTELRNSFHTCLKHLRRALGDALPVRYVAGAYQFEARLPLRYDVDDFRTAAEAARHAGATPAAVDALRDAAAHYRGDFLADAAVGGWAEPHRERLRREFEGVLHTLGGLLAQQRRFGEAADVFSRLLTHDPLLEAAHRGMMRCYAAHGDRGRALRQYQDLARLLDTQLGATPAPQTTQLYARLRAAS
jgi:DNA-binding SARP family transcriptional activator